MDLKDKKVLLVGLGVLGGGLATAKYLLAEGAKLTITDLRSKEELKASISKLPKDTRYVLGHNPEEELKKADLIILNPDVSAFSPLVKKIQELGKEYYSDYTFFLKSIDNTNPEAKIIGVTGTRGKTTVSTWLNTLIPQAELGGNIPERSPYKLIDKKTPLYVLELSSYQLEHLTKKDRSPNIAILTNIYVDHLNRYKTLKRYSDMKKKIYANQKEGDALIISNDHELRKEVEADKPKSKLYYVSLKELPKNKDGLYTLDNQVFFKEGPKSLRVGSVKDFAAHEKYNFIFAALAAHLSGISWQDIFGKIPELGNPHIRQQVIYDKNNIKVVNDSAGTSPDAVIAAIDKYKGDNLHLITGGTNKALDYHELAGTIAEFVDPNKLYFLSGSGTNELKELLPDSYFLSGNVREFDSLEEIVKTAAGEIKKGALVFSPGGSSFEKFKNEFDRGEQFNKLVKKYFN